MECICENCGEECNVIHIDQGIGSYEHFGYTGTHTDVVEVSECCEANYLEVE